MFCWDHTERPFYKELKKVIEASDVILEVLDARDPLGTRCTDLEKMVLKAGPEKHLVLLLNKIGNFRVKAGLYSGCVLGFRVKLYHFSYQESGANVLNRSKVVLNAFKYLKTF